VSFDPKFYWSKAWRAFRAKYLRLHPWCSVPGCTERATHLDHIIPRARAPDRAFDETNLAGLCASHHSRKTRVHDQVGRTDTYVHTLSGCDPSGEPLDPSSHWRN